MPAGLQPTSDQPALKLLRTPTIPPLEIDVQRRGSRTVETMNRERSSKVKRSPLDGEKFVVLARGFYIFSA
jgi:hypothetical protein